MQPAHYRAHGNVEHLGNFFVVKTFHISQQHWEPERFREGINGRFHLGIRERFQGNVFGGAIGFHGFKPAHSPVQKQVFNFLVQVGLRRFSAFGAVGVDLGVVEDPKQPSTQVGAVFKTFETFVGLEVGLLHKVLSIGVVVGHTHCR
jgi:hypothetical protein